MSSSSRERRSPPRSDGRSPSSRPAFPPPPCGGCSACRCTRWSIAASSFATSRGAWRCEVRDERAASGRPASRSPNGRPARRLRAASRSPLAALGIDSRRPAHDFGAPDAAGEPRASSSTPTVRSRRMRSRSSSGSRAFETMPRAPARCDVRVRVFDATLEDVHRMVPPPFAPVVRRDLERILEIHHRAASAFVLRPLRVRADRGRAAAAAGLRGIGDGADRDHRRPDAGAQPDDRVLSDAARARLPSPPRRRRSIGTARPASFSAARARASRLCAWRSHRPAPPCSARTTSWCAARRERLHSQRLRRQHAAHRADRGRRCCRSRPTGRKAWFGGVLKREFDLRQTGLDVRPFVDFAPRRIFFPAVGTRVAIEPMRRATAMARILDAIHDRHAIAGADDARGLLDVRWRPRRLARSLRARAQPPPLGPRRRRRLRGGRPVRSLVEHRRPRPAPGDAGLRSLAAGSSES